MRPDEEFSLPPEQSATLSGGRYGADRFGAPSRTLAEPGEAEEQALGALPEEGTGKAPEEEASPAEQDAQQTKARREKHRRSLLLQMAAAAASVVLVTSSFGIDVLGLDGLFNDSVILGEASTEHDSPERYDDEPELLFGDLMPFGGDRTFPGLSNEWTVTQDAMVDAHNRYIATAEFTQGSMGEQAMVDAFVWSDRKEPQFFTGPIPMSFPGTKVSAESDSIRYDENTNTLTLHNYHGKGLVVNGMGQDFTIRLEGDNRLDEYLLVGGGSLAITGDGGIVINEDNRFEYAAHVVGQWSEAYLMLDGSINYNLTGRHSAIRVTSTCAEKPVWYTAREAFKDVYQGQLRDENPSPITRDDNHYYSWLLCGGQDHSLIVKISNGYNPGKEGQTEPVQIETVPETEPEVTRLPVGGDSSFPMLPNPMPNAVGLDGQHHESSILAWEYLDRDGRIYGDMSIFAYEQHHPTGRDDIFYDPSSNTLTLNNFSGSRLDLRSMGNSFKIRLIGRNELSCGIQMMGDVTSGSITFTGDGYLALNTSRLSTYGLWLDAGSAPACVMIEASVTMDLYGSQAIAVWNTTADKAIYYLSGTVAGVYQESDYGEKSSSTGDTVYDWDSVDAQGNQVAHLHIGGEAPPETQASEELPGLPVGGDSSYPSLPNLEPGGTSPDGFRRGPQILLQSWDGTQDVYETFYLPDQGVGPMNTNSLSYDPASNTLTMNNYTGFGLDISDMGNSFKIRLVGRNILNGGIYIQGDYLGASICFTGDGYLYLNSPNHLSGLTVRGIFSETCVMIDSTVTMDLYGENYAFWIEDTSAEKAVYYQSDLPVSGVRQLIWSTEEDSSGTVSGSFNTWYSVGNDGRGINHIHIGGEVPEDQDSLPVGGDSSFPILPNPNPNTPVEGGYGILDEDYIQVFDRQANRWEFLYLNRNQTQNTVSQSGISYDRSTNTLTLNNYHGAGISANMMGNSFTVELIGENVLTQDFMIWGFYTAGSVHFTGTGSLSINTDLVSPIGLDLECEFSESCIMIDESVTLDIYGSAYALVVNGTITDKGVYLISPAPRPGVWQTVYTQQMPDVDWVSQKPHKVWILTGSDTGDPLTRFRIEGTGRVNNR